MKKLIMIVFVMLFSITFVSANLMSIQGIVTDSDGNNVNGNLRILIYDSLEGGNLIYDSLNDFNDKIINGRYDVLLGSGEELSLNYGEYYYLSLLVNDEILEFDGKERQIFQSNIGNVNKINDNLQINGSLLINGTSGSTPMEGSGVRLMWIPDKAAFRAGYAIGTEWDDQNIGDYSTAMGFETTASGDYSFAMSRVTNASGIASTAMGGWTTASGSHSTAMGNQATASGTYSTAMGILTTASGSASTAMGGLTTASGDYSFAAGRMAKALQDGVFALSDSEYAYFEVDQADTFGARFAGGYWLTGGNVGIGTTDPQAKLHVNGSLLINGTSGSTPMEGSGVRLMWIPDKAAFRAGEVRGSDSEQGYIEGTSWDEINIGDNSFAIGRNTKASGAFSTALGSYTEASGAFSTSLGRDTIASGDFSTSIGGSTEASGQLSFAAGRRAKALEDGVFAFSDSKNEDFEVNQEDTFGARFAGGYWLTGGNVGIGTTNPQTTLDVNGTIRTSSVGGLSFVNITETGNVFMSGKLGILDGNVGIGTLNPHQNLHLTANDDVVLRLQATGTGGKRWDIWTSTEPNNYLGFHEGATDKTHMVISDIGNVGIGTTNPQAKLDVNGSVKINSVLHLNPTNSPGDCEITSKGSIYMDDSLSKPCFCNGTNWVLFENSEEICE